MIEKWPHEIKCACARCAKYRNALDAYWQEKAPAQKSCVWCLFVGYLTWGAGYLTAYLPWFPTDSVLKPVVCCCLIFTGCALIGIAFCGFSSLETQEKREAERLKQVILQEEYARQVMERGRMSQEGQANLQLDREAARSQVRAFHKGNEDLLCEDYPCLLFEADLRVRMPVSQSPDEAWETAREMMVEMHDVVQKAKHRARNRPSKRSGSVNPDDV